MMGVLTQAQLENEIARAHLGAVTQAYSGGEFNVPSKLMNYLAVGLPVVASVRPESEAARIIDLAGAGWVTDSSNPSEFADSIVDAMSRPEELTKRSESGMRFANANLTVDVLADKFETAMFDAVQGRK